MQSSVVLIVDDDPDIALVCSLQLEGAGFVTLQAGTGESAVELARREQPSVILLDYMLPDLDGVEVIRRLREEPATHDIPVVMLTARTDAGDQRAAWEAGIIDYVTKPFDGDRLVDAVRDAVAPMGAVVPAQPSSPSREAAHPVGSQVDDSWLIGVIQGAHDAIICNTVEGEITYWNEGAAELYGWRASEALGRDISMLTSRETEEEVQEILARVARGETVNIYDTVRLHRDGTRLNVSLCVSPILDAAGAVTGSSVIARDITARVRAEQRHEQLVEQAPDAIVVVDTDGVIEVVNRQTELLFGYSREQLVGRSVEVLVPTEVRETHRGHRRGFAAAPRHRPMDPGLSLRARRADGTEFPVAISLSPLHAETGAGFAATVRDLSERRLVEEAKALVAEREREARARMREVDRIRTDFLSTVSHELRTPLTAIKGFSEYLTSSWEGTSDERKRDMVHRIQHAGDRLDTLIQDLLDFSRLERGQVEIEVAPVGLVTVVDDALRQTAGALEAHEVDCAVATEHVLADRATLVRVVENLLTNAAKFSPAGSRIDVRSRIVGDAVELSVRDRGVGVPPEEGDKVFDRFYRTTATSHASPGTGIGLAIVRQFVQAQGGEVGLRTPGDAGAEFWVRLRRADT